jgi:hypothetical protein
MDVQYIESTEGVEMLSDRTSEEADEAFDGDEVVAVDSGSRSIAEILERSRARRRRRSYTRAPGFVHGNRRLDALYETFGQTWVHETAFVERLPEGGEAAGGWTVATFEDGFLTIEHGLADELEDLDAWLASELEEVERVVFLTIDPGSEPAIYVDGVDVIGVDSSRARLQQLETRELDLTRDRDFGRGAPFAPSRSERLLESRLDVMSLICLAAKLVAPSR